MQFLNILIGSLETSHVNYLYDCQPLLCAPSSNSIAVVDDAVRSLGINTNSISLLWSNALKYMASAGALLKSRYPKLFHATCVPHLLHNCAMKVKSHFEDADQLIAKVKLVTVKSKTRQVKVATICCLPQRLRQNGKGG